MLVAIERGPNQQHAPLASLFHTFISFSSDLTCSPCGQDLSKTTSVCPQEARSAARSLAGKNPNTVRGSTCPQIIFSESPGAGGLPLSAGFVCIKFNYLISISSWRREAFESYRYSLTRTRNCLHWDLLCLFLSRDSSVFLGHSHNNASFLSYSWKNKTGREQLTLETTNASKSSQDNKIFRTNAYACVSPRPWAKKKFLNCFIKPL